MNKTFTEMITLGMLSYSNALPLSDGLREEQGLRLHYDTPNRLFAALQQDIVDCALTSSLHLEDPTLFSFSDYGISAYQEVLSVNLYHTLPVKQLSGKKIAISNETTTSFALLKILCKHLWKITPEFVPFSPEQNYDAFLLIGDKALEKQKTDSCDLATAWYELTGLPFVFALFFAPITKRDVLPCEEIEQKIKKSLLSGLQKLDLLAERIAKQQNLPFNLIQRYYQKLHYLLGPREKAGLKQFITLHRETYDSVSQRRT